TLPLLSQFVLSKDDPPAALECKSRGPGKSLTWRCGTDVEAEHSGTVQWGSARCPACGESSVNSYLQEQGKAGKLGHYLLAKVVSGSDGRSFALATDRDRECFDRAVAMLDVMTRNNTRLLPTEPAAKHGQRSCSNLIYGFNTWESFFNRRQLLVLTTLAALTR